MLLNWSFKAWEDYVEWQSTDKQTVKKINSLIKAIKSDPFTGEGKPEPLKGDLKGFWSRHINDKDRLVYQIVNGNIEIASCKTHYQQH